MAFSRKERVSRRIHPKRSCRLRRWGAPSPLLPVFYQNMIPIQFSVSPHSCSVIAILEPLVPSQGHSSALHPRPGTHRPVYRAIAPGLKTRPLTTSFLASSATRGVNSSLLSSVLTFRLDLGRPAVGHPRTSAHTSTEPIDGPRHLCVLASSGPLDHYGGTHRVLHYLQPTPPPPGSQVCPWSTEGKQDRGKYYGAPTLLCAQSDAHISS